MMGGKVNAPLLALNRGEVSQQALARVDVDRLRLAAETQVNYMPTVLGSMSLRPGLAKVGAVLNDAPCNLIPFIYGVNDTALIEVASDTIRIWIDDQLVMRNGVSTQLQNPTFAASTGWTLTATAGCTATIATNALTLSALARGGIARAEQIIGVASADLNVEHGLRIVVTNGPVTVRMGSTSGGRDVIRQTALDTGTHSLAFTPTTGNLYLQIESTDTYPHVVTQVQVESAGELRLPSPWGEGDLDFLRWDQSGDVIYVGCRSRQQRKIERRDDRSWSVVLYKCNDGPFNVFPTATVELTPGNYYGNTTLTSNLPFFEEDHAGALFRLFTSGQRRKALLGAQGAKTDAIRVQGIGTDRNFSWIVAGTFVGTLQLQRSFDGADAGFVNIDTPQTAPATTAHTDAATYDNVECWYRVVFTAYTSGSATVEFTYAGGGGDRGLKHRADEELQTTPNGGLITAQSGGGGAGICRVTSYVSSTQVNVEVLKDFSNLVATDDWQEGDWSELQGFPDVPVLYEGRLWWLGRDQNWGSISDGYQSYDLDYEGDAGPIIRTFGSGPVQITNWALALDRLVVGREMAATVIRSSNADEPITPTTYSSKDFTTQGAAQLPAVRIDKSGVYVNQSERRVYAIVPEKGGPSYDVNDLTRLNLDIGVPGFRWAAVQRQPDTVIHFPLGDGRSAALLYDPQDDVVCWTRIETQGSIERHAVLPSRLEDAVYCVVRRTINGVTRRFIEKLARRDQCLGRPEARHADCHVTYTGAPVTTIGGLSHLEGCDVVVWGWNTAAPFTATLPDGSEVTVGRDMGVYKVSGGAISGLPAPVTDACVGLPYAARFKSAKLAYAAQKGTALTQTKKVDHVGFILIDTHHAGVEYGQSFDRLDALPLTAKGAEIAPHTVWPAFDEPMIECPGEWDTDARLCLRSAAPRPATITAVVVGMETNET
jgi:hypothetical protein